MVILLITIDGHYGNLLFNLLVQGQGLADGFQELLRMRF